MSVLSPQPDIEPVDLSSPEARLHATKMVMSLFDHWQLAPRDQLTLLGLSENSKSSLTRYRRGKPIANRRDTLERVGMLLGIHTRLRTLFPHNRDCVYAWMSSPNKAFDGLTPVGVVRQHGDDGLSMLVRYLEKAMAE